MYTRLNHLHTVQDEPRFNTLFVLGIGHSGSTLLGRMLDMHPAVVCVGELLRLEEALDNAGEKCSCGSELRECAFWARCLEKIPPKVQKNYKRWTPDLLSAVRQVEGRKLLVDLSKTRAHRLSARWKDPAVGYVLLLRDPRGVLRSTAAKGEDLKRALKPHRKWVGRLENFARDNPRRCLTMHYEDLVTDPETSIRRICDFVGLTFMPEMLTPDSKIHHFVRSSGSNYLKGTNRFQLDERWRRELTPEQTGVIRKYLKDVPIYRERYKLGSEAISDQ